MISSLNDSVTGVYLLMLTPFNEDKTVDYKAYEAYCEFQASQGAEHLFAVCGSSEMAELTLEERLTLASLTVKHRGNTTVVATANMEKDLASQLEEVRRMEETGVDGLVFTTKGMGNEPEKLVSYIGELKSKTKLPVFMYEFPGLKPHLISGETYARLVNECGVRGIKDTTCTVEGIGSKIENRGDSCVIQANMPLLFEAYKMGARGIMATPTTCGGGFFARFHNAFTSGDMKEAKRRYEEIILLDNAIGASFNVSAKYLVALQGVSGFRPINRSGKTLTQAGKAALEAFYGWCAAEGLMGKSDI